MAMTLAPKTRPTTPPTIAPTLAFFLCEEPLAPVLLPWADVPLAPVATALCVMVFVTKMVDPPSVWKVVEKTTDVPCWSEAEAAEASPLTTLVISDVCTEDVATRLSSVLSADTLEDVPWELLLLCFVEELELKLELKLEEDEEATTTPVEYTENELSPPHMSWP